MTRQCHDVNRRAGIKHGCGLVEDNEFKCARGEDNTEVCDAMRATEESGTLCLHYAKMDGILGQCQHNAKGKLGRACSSGMMHRYMWPFVVQSRTNPGLQI